MRKESILLLGIAFALLVTAIPAKAETVVHIEWNSPNPNIQASLHQIGSGIVAADVSGSGDDAASTASGEIDLRSNPSAGWGTVTAYQIAEFENLDYFESSVYAYGDEGDGIPPWSSQGWETLHYLAAEGVANGIVEQGTSAIRNFRGVEGGQTYSVTADSVEVSGFVFQQDWKWRGESSVDFYASAEGDVSGSQYALAGYQGEYNTGFGAGISGTEGDVFFGFSTVTPNPANALYDITSLQTFHTTVIGSGYTVVGETHTWLELPDPDDDPWDENFDWIEP